MNFRLPGLNIGRLLERTGILKRSSLIVAVLVGFLGADLAIIAVRPYLLPESSSIKSPPPPLIVERPSRANYEGIVARNLFSRDGIIPKPLADILKHEQPEALPVLSQLPLTLLGTIVHVNPQKSVATIQVKGQPEAEPYIVGENIENLAVMVRIERKKAIFRNENNKRLEFIEIKEEDGGIRFGGYRGNKSGGGDGGPIEKMTENDLRVSRALVEKSIADLPALLQQARAVPYRDPNTGEIGGFRILDIQPGSIFEQLGIQRMDIIKSVNGEPVNSPNKAMEMFNALRNSPNVEIGIERNGRNETMNYNIH